MKTPFAYFNVGAQEEHLIPVGSMVNIVGGTYKNQEAKILGRTAKMYNVEILMGRFAGKVTVVKQNSVERKSASRAKAATAATATADDNDKQIIKEELANIQGSLERMTAAMGRLNVNLN
jgi:hypothetical protein